MVVGIIGTPGRVHGLAVKSFEKSFSEVGGNTGNLLFQYASHKSFTGEKRFFSWDVEPDVINKTCKVLVLPLANQIGTHTDYARRAELISKIRIPIVALGLGAQSHTLSRDSIDKLCQKISSGTKHWLQEISARASKILVRGDYTVDVCNALGVKNVESFGCPSNLISSNRELGSLILSKLENVNISSVILNGGFYTLGKNNYSKIVEFERKVLSDKSILDKSIVVQAPKDIMECSYGGRISNTRVSDVSEGIISKVRLDSFYDVDHWSHHTRNFDMSIGTRIHGAMLSLQFGHPTVLVTHDSRTTELSEIMGIPRISLKSAIECQSVSEMVGRVDFDANFYDARRSSMAHQIKDLFNDYDLRLSSGIEKLL